MSKVRKYGLTAGWDHIRLGVELEFISQVPVSASDPEDYEFTFVTQALNKDSRDIRFKFNDGKGHERFDYERAWTLTAEGTVDPDPTLYRPGSKSRFLSKRWSD